MFVNDLVVSLDQTRKGFVTCCVGEVAMLVHIAGKKRLQVPDFKAVFEDIDLVTGCWAD